MSHGSGSAADLSRRALGIEVSPTVAMAQLAGSLKAKGEKVLDFTVGEPDQPTPAHVSAAARDAIDAGITRYTPSLGIPALRKAVAERYREDFHVSFADDEVAVTNGGKHALYATCQLLLDRGDEVIIPSPYWPTFAEAVRLAGGQPVLVPTREEDGFRITARVVGEASTPRTKAVIVNSPCNPTGAVIDPEDLLVIGDMAERRKFTLLYDDTYARLSFSSGPEAPLQRLRDSIGDRLVILGTASKTYCMTGWRIGWIMGPKALVAACGAHVSHSTQCPTAFAQTGAVAALTGPQEGVAAMVAEYLRRRDAVLPLLRAIPGVTCVEPGGAFYFFPNVSACLGGAVPTTLDLARVLLEQTRVAVVPGEGFGLPGHVRVSFARPVEELEEGVRRMASVLGGLRTGKSA